MARFKIKDLPKGMKITKEELKRIWGGAITCLHSTDVLAAILDSGDYGTDSTTNLPTMRVNVRRVEFK